jgi:radical SAM superfamily enzyme YgiQ (UPF0313 family)
MKIILILPFDSTYQYKKGSFKKSLRYPPITLTILAGLIPKELNADVRIVDEGVEPLENDFCADLVGISAVTATAPRAYALADKIRKRGIPVVLGGVHPTVMPEEAIQHADSVVIGFAEQSWPQLLRDFARGELKKFYNMQQHLSIANLPFPRRDLLKKDAYLTINTIIATRGCPNRCRFCTIPVARQGKYYHRPIEDVIEEIKLMKAKKLIFLDASPTEDVNYSKALYKSLIPLKVKWVGLTTTKIMQEKELIDLAVKSGCFGLLFGFETISQSALCQSKKDFNCVDEYKEMVNILHDKGIGVLGCFMFGFDADDKTVFERTVEFIDKTKIDLLRYTIFTPFPGTGAYDDLKAQGRIIEDNWEYYDYEHVVFKPAKMSPEELYNGIVWIWNQTYSMKAIAKRLLNSNLFLGELVLANFGFRHHAKQLLKNPITERQ